MPRKLGRSPSPFKFEHVSWWMHNGTRTPIDDYTGHPHLADLPLELLGSITDQLDLSAVCAMRATCKSLYIVLLDAFVDAFFADNVFRLLDRATMQMICNISEIPRLARRVQNFNLAAETVDSNLHAEWRARCLSNRRKDGAFLLDYDISHLDTDATDKNLNEQKFFKEELRGILEALLSNFRRAGASLRIDLAPRLSQCRCIWGTRRSGLSDMALFRHELPNDRIRNYSYVYEALANTGYNARGLDIIDGRTGDSLDISWFSSIGQSITTSSLRSLRIFMSAFYQTPEHSKTRSLYVQERRKNILSFVVFLARSPGIEDFELNLHWGKPSYHRKRSFEIEEGLFHAVLTRSYMDGSPLPLPGETELLPNLKSLRLTSSPTSQEVDLNKITEFCKQRQKTLRKLALKGVSYHGKEILQAGDQIRAALVGERSDDDIDVTLDNCYGYI